MVSNFRTVYICILVEKYIIEVGYTMPNDFTFPSALVLSNFYRSQIQISLKSVNKAISVLGILDCTLVKA